MTGDLNHAVEGMAEHPGGDKAAVPLSYQEDNAGMKELPGKPRGLYFQRDFITPEHERELIVIFRNELEWPVRSGSTDTTDGASLGRLSLHYGLHFDYKTFGVDPDIPFVPFPEWLKPLLPPTEPDPPDQVCLQYYPPGSGIPPHCDTHAAFERLYALSLGAPVIMEFRRPIEVHSDKGVAATVRQWEKRDVDLLPRSMVQMEGDSRYHWQHGIKKRKSDTVDGQRRLRQDRWSITYRWLRKPAPVCECGDALLCDTAKRRAGVEQVFRWKKDDSA